MEREGVANPPRAGGDGERGEIADCAVEAHIPQRNEASVASAEGLVEEALRQHQAAGE